jgi:hypothetical protein
MIYDPVLNDAPILQGDIFTSLPRVDVSLKKVFVVDADLSPYEMTWADAAESRTGASQMVRAILPLYPVDAIVITQSCDAARADNVSLCEIVPVDKVLKDSQSWVTKTWARNLTKQDTENLRWFYLPPGGATGFQERRAVDFRTVIHLLREELEAFKQFRKGRLNKVAYEHFREKLAQFFRRYPYNPWYPLDKNEFQAYAGQQHEPVEPYEWQR